MTRNWSLGPAAWVWPDDVDETGCDNRMAVRYLPIEHTEYGGSGWQVAKVFVDEGDDEMLADAQLIAAAPELLAACREMAEIIHSMSESGVGLAAGAAAPYMAVIRRAEGLE